MGQLLYFPLKPQSRQVYRLRLVLDATPGSEDMPPFGQLAGCADLASSYSWEEAVEVLKAAVTATGGSVGWQPEKIK